MYPTDIGRDITTSIGQALALRLDLLDEAGLVERSDALLARLPGLAGLQPVTTALLVGRYHTPLQTELYRVLQSRPRSASAEDALRELTRAVLLTVGIGEGIPVEAAVGMALVLYKHGLAPISVQPVLRPSTTLSG